MRSQSPADEPLEVGAAAATGGASPSLDKETAAPAASSPCLDTRRPQRTKADLLRPSSFSSVSVPCTESKTREKLEDAFPPPTRSARELDDLLAKERRELPEMDAALVTDTLLWLGVVQRCVTYLAELKNVSVKEALRELRIDPESVLFDVAEESFVDS